MHLDPCARRVSLLELVLVGAACLAISIGVATTVTRDLHASFERVARIERAELERAVSRFLADTGHLPYQGPFALQGDGEGRVPRPSSADAVAAFYAPASWGQLLQETSPLASSHEPAGVTHPLGRWSPRDQRGWRGPYLRLDSACYVLDPNGATTPTHVAVPSVPEAFPGGAYLWFSGPEARPEQARGPSRSAPYLHNFDPRVAADVRWIRAAGPNGVHEGGEGDDVTITIR